MNPSFEFQCECLHILQDGTLRTATKFNHKLQNKYFLQIRVFDNGSPPLYSDTYVSVNIIEESQYPPSLFPLEIGIISYQDDFPGAVVGQIKASDQDPYDKLNYEIVSMNNPTNSMPSTQILNEAQNLFEIDHSDGTIIALQGLDVGGYSLNISVSDGKFTSFTTARVNVNLVSKFEKIVCESQLIKNGCFSFPMRCSLNLSSFVLLILDQRSLYVTT